MKSPLFDKRLLLLGGTRISCEIVRIARGLGCFVGVADYNSVKDSPAKQIADAAYDVDVTDVKAVVQLIKDENFDGVIVGFADAILPAYAEICRLSGLPGYATKEQLELFTQKNLYKPLLRKYGIPTIDEYRVDEDRFEETTDDIIFPVLVKPADSAGARGITICHNRETLKTAIAKAHLFSRSGNILIERYIEGREITVNWLFKGGDHYLTCIANRHVKSNQDDTIPLPVGYTYPSTITPLFQKKYEMRCKKMFRDQGLSNGTMFMQCKVDNGVPYVYDIGYRMTGTMEVVNLEDACDFNPIKMMINFALTGDMGEPDIRLKLDPLFGGKYGFNVSCLGAPGKIASIEGLEKVARYPEVSRIVVEHYPGETISESMRGLLAQICVRIIGTVQDKNELYLTMKKIDDTIDIISSEGKTMKLPGIEHGDFEGVV